MKQIKDPIIKRVVDKFVDRSNVGFKKYGVTLMDDKSNMDEWLNHLQEELMDAVNYIERARVELKAINEPECCKKFIHCTCSKLDNYGKEPYYYNSNDFVTTCTILHDSGDCALNYSEGRSNV